jgi:hypothetical protein
MNKINNISDTPKFERWVHPEAKKRRREYSYGQRGHVIWGMEIYEYLRDNNLLSNCLSLSDLENIKERGVAFFERHFNKGRMFDNGTPDIMLVALRGVEIKNQKTPVPYLHVSLGGCLWVDRGYRLDIGYHPLWSIVSSLRPLIRFARR